MFSITAQRFSVCHLDYCCTFPTFSLMTLPPNRLLDCKSVTANGKLLPVIFHFLVGILFLVRSCPSTLRQRQTRKKPLNYQIEYFRKLIISVGQMALRFLIKPGIKKTKTNPMKLFCAEIHHFHWRIQKKVLNCAHKQTEFTKETLFSLKVSNQHKLEVTNKHPKTILFFLSRTR